MTKILTYKDKTFTEVTTLKEGLITPSLREQVSKTNYSTCKIVSDIIENSEDLKDILQLTERIA